MAYDYAKLNGRIIEKCGTRKAFAEKMGFSEATISKNFKIEFCLGKLKFQNPLKSLNFQRMIFRNIFLHKNFRKRKLERR